jgi:hypothetical protein
MCIALIHKLQGIVIKFFNYKLIFVVYYINSDYIFINKIHYINAEHNDDEKMIKLKI